MRSTNGNAISPFRFVVAHNHHVVVPSRLYFRIAHLKDLFEKLVCLGTSMIEEVINGPTITLLNTRREFSIRLLIMRLEFEVYASDRS